MTQKQIPFIWIVAGIIAFVLLGPQLGIQSTTPKVVFRHCEIGPFVADGGYTCESTSNCIPRPSISADSGMGLKQYQYANKIPIANIQELGLRFLPYQTYQEFFIYKHPTTDTIYIVANQTLIQFIPGGDCSTSPIIHDATREVIYDGVIVLSNGTTEPPKVSFFNRVFLNLSGFEITGKYLIALIILIGGLAYLYYRK